MSVEFFEPLMQCDWYKKGARCDAFAGKVPTFPRDLPVLALCPRHARTMKGWLVSDPSLPIPGAPKMFVYFILNRQANQIKIGHSNQPDKRIRSLSSQAGIEFETLMIVPETSEFNEALAHTVMNQLRIQGEWFEATPFLYEWMSDVKTWSKK